MQLGVRKWQLLTNWTGEDEAERVRNPAIIMDVFIAVDHKCNPLVKEATEVESGAE